MSIKFSQVTRARRRKRRIGPPHWRAASRSAAPPPTYSGAVNAATAGRRDEKRNHFHGASYVTSPAPRIRSVELYGLILQISKRCQTLAALQGCKVQARACAAQRQCQRPPEPRIHMASTALEARTQYRHEVLSCSRAGSLSLARCTCLEGSAAAATPVCGRSRRRHYQVRPGDTMTGDSHTRGRLTMSGWCLLFRRARQTAVMPSAMDAMV